MGLAHPSMPAEVACYRSCLLRNSHRQGQEKEPFPSWSHLCGTLYHQRWELRPPFWSTKRILKHCFANRLEVLRGGVLITGGG